MVGGSDFAEAALQPRHAGAPPARLGVQAVHPGRGARGGHLARAHVRLRPEDARAARGATSRSRTTRTATPASPRWPAPRPRPTTRSTRRWATSSSARGRSRRSPAGWASAPRSREPGDGAWRPQAGSHAARDGEVLRDAGRGRQASSPARLPRVEGRPRHLHEGQGRGHRRQERGRAQAGDPGGDREAGDADPLQRRHVGTGRAAQIGEFAAGKTGTTENYQDAWFVGIQRRP